MDEHTYSLALKVMRLQKRRKNLEESVELLKVRGGMPESKGVELESRTQLPLIHGCTVRSQQQGRPTQLCAYHRASLDKADMCVCICISRKALSSCATWGVRQIVTGLG